MGSSRLCLWIAVPSLVLLLAAAPSAQAAKPTPRPLLTPVKPGPRLRGKPAPSPWPRPARPRPVLRPVIPPKHAPRAIRLGPAPAVVAPPAQKLPVPPPIVLPAHAAVYRITAVDPDFTVWARRPGETLRVRMVGVEPPAGDDGGDSRMLEPAWRFARQLLVGQSVRLAGDPHLADHDAEGKRLAYLYRASDRLLLNQELVRAGWGVVAEDYAFEHQEAFLAQQRRAQAGRQGVWGLVP